MEMKNSGLAWTGQIPQTWQVCRLKYLAEIKTGSFNTQDELDEGAFPFYVRSPKVRRLNSYSFDGIGILMSGDGAGAGKIFHYATGKYAVHQRVYNIYNFKEIVFPKFLYYFISHLFPKQVDAWSAKSTVDSIRLPMLKNFEIAFPNYRTQKNIAEYLDSNIYRINNIILKTQTVIAKLEEYKQSLITQTVTKGLDPDAEMKDSGVEWIGKIPNTWNISKIKYIAQLNPSIKHSILTDSSQVTYTPMEYIKNGYFINNSCEYSAVRKCSYTAYLEGDIAIAKVTPCFENGNIAIMKGLESSIGFGSSELFILRATNILTEYLFYFLQNDNFKAQCVLSFSGASGLKRVSGFFLNNCPITVPPIEIQLDIINFLNKKIKKINELISTKHKLINKLEDYKKSLIFEYVTGKKTVGEN